MNSNSQKAEERIQEAMIALLKKENFDNVSIKEILYEAKVSKSTFYRLFEDKYDVLNKSLLYAMNKYVNPDQFNLNEWRKFFIDLLSRFKLSRTLKMFYHHSSKAQFVAVQQQFFLELITKRIERCGNRYDESLNLELYILASSCASAMYYWVKTDFTLSVNDLIDRVCHTIPAKVRELLMIR